MVRYILSSRDQCYGEINVMIGAQVITHHVNFDGIHSVQHPGDLY